MDCIHCALSRGCGSDRTETAAPGRDPEDCSKDAAFFALSTRATDELSMTVIDPQGVSASSDRTAFPSTP